MRSGVKFFCFAGLTVFKHDFEITFGWEITEIFFFKCYWVLLHKFFFRSILKIYFCSIVSGINSILDPKKFIFFSSIKLPPRHIFFDFSYSNIFWFVKNSSVDRQVAKCVLNFLGRGKKVLPFSPYFDLLFMTISPAEMPIFS